MACAMMRTAAQLTAALLDFRECGPAGQDDRGDFGGERYGNHGGPVQRGTA